MSKYSLVLPRAIAAGDSPERHGKMFCQIQNSPACVVVKNVGLTCCKQVAFYPSKVDAAYVDGEKVKPQAGDFYGGWITSKIVGPFKGEAGTMWW